MGINGLGKHTAIADVGAYVQYTCLCWRKSVVVGIRVQIRSTIKHYEVYKKWLAFWRMMTM